MTGAEMQSLSEAQRTVLDAFLRALARESHVLQGRSDLPWQQLHNRLQWTDEPVHCMLEPEHARRCRPSAEPRMKSRTPPHESEALTRTLTGHTGSIGACAIGRDGQYATPGYWDHTIFVWNLEHWCGPSVAGVRLKFRSA